jgi:hypothetical protein
MQAHERHFPITGIYKMSLSPPAFLRILAMVTAKSILWADFVG